MPRLSVIMIVKNEAHCLSDCLQSVQHITGEMVVADTGSTDDTPEIARSHGARLIHVPWNNDFAAARNATITAATGDWLLHLDADEMIDPGAAQAIRELIERDGDGHDAVELTLLNYCNTPRAWRWRPVEPGNLFSRGFAGYLPVPLLRLFRAGQGYVYREPVHENITESVHERGGRVLTADIAIHHYGYDPETPRAREKVRNYLEIARKKLREHPEDLKALHDVAEQALACGFEEEAEEVCRRAVAIDPCNLAAAATLANILLSRGQLDEARPILETVQAHGRAPAHIAVALAAIALKQGELDDAQRRLHCALHADPRAVVAHWYHARVLDVLGEEGAAAEALETARQLAPTLRETRDRIEARRLRALGEAQYTAGAAVQALEPLVAALSLDPEDPLLHNDLGVVLHALGQPEKARESFTRALQLCAGVPGVRENLQAL
jgi:Tfp pilus assembly protein PilF